MNKRGDLEYLHDIKKSIELIQGYVDNISQSEFIDNYSDIPWKRMAGMRDVLIHQYHGIDLEIVWQTINEVLPEVYSRIEYIIDELKE